MAYTTGRNGIDQIVGTPGTVNNHVNTQIDEDAMFSDLEGSQTKNIAYT